MYTGTDSTDSSNHVMVVTINNPTSNTPTYTAVLSQAFDHNTTLLENDNIEFDFNISLSDDDNDTSASTFKVSIVDDIPLSVQELIVDEEGDTGSHDTSTTINTNADATSSNTVITTNGTYGYAVINDDGTLTYTPSFDGTNSIATNYSGADTVTYTTTLEDGTTNVTTVNVTVNPISDAPGITRDANKISTLEDTAVALGFNAPTITDAQDQNNTDVSDYSELLGLITLINIPDGAKLLSGNDTELFTSNGSRITIKLTDGNHHSDVGTADLEMTSAEFEALKVLPNPEDATDFNFKMQVREYEVDENGEPLDIDDYGKSTITVQLDVLAVTDPVDIKINGSDSDYTAVMNEDTAIDLKALLSTNSFVDLDGSENRTIVISDIPSGTIINGTTVTSGTYSISLTGSGNDTIPSLSLTPPVNFSGVMSTMTITLVAHDTDTDSTHSDSSTVDTTDLSNKTIYDTQDSVTLNLTVNPIADEITDISDKNTNEDTSVVFLSDLDLTDKDSNGTESLRKLVISGLEEDSVITYDGVSTTIDSTNTFTIGDGSTNLDISKIQAISILPPAHSSKDMSITLTATVQDVNGANVSTIDSVKTFDLVINPIAESTETNSAGIAANDIITQGDHTYVTHASEDVFFDLNTADSGFVLSLTNEDSISETTSVLFTPSEVGTIFKYGSTELTYNTTAIEIPVSELSNLQVKAPAEYSGTLVITTEVKSIDNDDDSTNPENANTLISQGDTLTITVAPVADAVTLSISQSIGNEDAGRVNGNDTSDGNDTSIDLSKGIPLNIAASSDDKDGSETVTLKIADIPTGSEVYYNGVLVDTSSGIIEIASFDNADNLIFIPPVNFSGDINLDVSAKSIDGISEGTYSDSLPLNIKVKAVADLLTGDDLNTLDVDGNVDSNGTYDFVTNEETVDNESNQIMLNNIYLDQDNITLYDENTPSSEAATFIITNLDDKFDISGGTFIGGSGTSRQWVLTLDELKDTDASSAVYIQTEENFAGEINFDIKNITTEVAGSSNTQAKNISIFVSPDASDGTLKNLTLNQNEDSWTTLSFDFKDNDGDDLISGKETLETVYIKESDLVNLDLSYDGISLIDIDSLDDGPVGYVKLSNLNDIQIKAKDTYEHSDDTYTIDIKYDIKDDANSLKEVSSTKDATVTINVDAVTDTPIAVFTDTTTTIGTSETINTDDVDTSNNSFTKTIQIDSPDTDGSEDFTRVEVTGVPIGIGIVGAVFAKDTWYVETPDVEITGVKPTITLEFVVISGFSEIVDTPITIKTFTQDNDPALENSTTVEFDLTLIGNGDSTGTGSLISDFAKGNDVVVDEDNNTFTLGDVISNASLANPSAFSLSLEGLPEGVNLNVNGSLPSGITLIKQGDIWILNGSGNTSVTDLSSVLSQIEIEPEADYSTNDTALDDSTSLDGVIKFDATLTAYGSGGSTEVQTIEGLEATVKPITDLMDFDSSTTNMSVVEDETTDITLDLTNSKDGSNVEIIDGQIYFKVTENYTGTTPNSGTLTDSSGNPLSTVTNPSGLDAGTYYVLPVDNNNLPSSVTVKYEPGANEDGNVSIDAFVKHKETHNISGHDSTEKISQATFALDVEQAPDALDLSVTKPAAVLEESPVKLEYTVSNIDEGDELKSIVLDDIPENYIVYYIDENGDEVMASNSGSSNGSTYSWNVPVIDSSNPPSILVQPPLHASGISNISMKVITTENIISVSEDIEIEITPVADDVSINPTLALGDEYTWTDINLNATLNDTDGSETITASFDFNDTTDEDALFSLDGGSTVITKDSNNPIYYTVSNGVYTIVGIPSSDISDLSILHAEFDGSVDVSITTVDGTSTNEVTDSFDLKLASSNDITTADEDNVITTSDAGITVDSGAGDDTVTGGLGNDTIDGGSGSDIINSGAGDDIIKTDGFDTIDAGLGFDTIILDSASSIDFTKLSNIEEIDSSNVDLDITLSLQDVLDMTDDNNELIITGDSSDNISFLNETGAEANTWSKEVGTGADSGFDIYSNDSDSTVKVKVQTEISDGITG